MVVAQKMHKRMYSEIRRFAQRSVSVFLSLLVYLVFGKHYVAEHNGSLVQKQLVLIKQGLHE